MMCMVRSTYSLRTSSAVGRKDLLKAPSKAFIGAELVPKPTWGTRIYRRFRPLLRRFDWRAGTR